MHDAELPMVLGWLEEPKTVDMDNEEGHQSRGAATCDEEEF